MSVTVKASKNQLLNRYQTSQSVRRAINVIHSQRQWPSAPTYETMSEGEQESIKAQVLKHRALGRVWMAQELTQYYQVPQNISHLWMQALIEPQSAENEKPKYHQLSVAEQIDFECEVLKLLKSGKVSAAQEMADSYQLPPNLLLMMVKLARLGVSI